MMSDGRIGAILDSSPAAGRRRICLSRPFPTTIRAPSPSEDPLMSTSPKVAVVTGAGTGIGKAAAVALLHEGYRVAFAGRRREPLEQAIAEAGAAQGAALAVPTDVADPASVRCAVRARSRNLRPPRRPLQQRRRRRARREPRGAHVRAVEERRRHQPDRRVPVHAAGHSDDEGADAARRPDHQQRIDLGARAAPEFGALHGDEARDHGPHEIDVARRAQIRHRVRADRHRQRSRRTWRRGWRRAFRRPTARSPSSR